MFRHNFLISLRSFKRHKTTFFINLIGLSTGLACALLIFLWVQDELRMDKFHENDERLYQVMQNAPLPDGMFTTEGTPGLLYEALAQEMPEVEEASVAAYARGGRLSKGIISFEDTYLKASELHVSQNYFNVFSYRLIHGNKDFVLSDKYSAVLSDELALKLFHTTENIVGKTVEWKRGDLSGPYTVTGVFEKPQANSSAQFDLLLTYELLFEKHADNLGNWGNSNPMTYLILKEGTDIEQFNHKIKDFSKSKYNDLNDTNGDWIGTLFLQRYSDKYLYNRFENGVQSGGRIEYVRLFSIIALFILLIACINFTNLSTAKASTKIMEVGVKKALGAGRKPLIIQHLSESILMTFLSLAVAMLLVVLLLPQFNMITGKQLALIFDTQLAVSLLCIVLITGLMAGSYPALYLSGFNPVAVLKGHLKTSIGEVWMRKGLVVFQFALSVILIVSVLVVYKQIEFVQNKNLGYNKDNIIRFVNEGKLLEGTETFLSEIKKIPGVVSASSFGNDITENKSSTSGLDWEGKNDGEAILFGNLQVDYDLMELFDFEMREGRIFSREFKTEGSKIIFNEAAIAAMGLNYPVGKTIRLWGEEKQIIGVVTDFHFESLYEEIKPCFLQFSPNQPNILVRIETGLEQETISRIQKFYQMYNDGLPFEYSFLDEEYQAQYASEQRISTLSRYFAGLAIIISCLGLFGLAAFTAQRRLKEIGIRKILGATDFGIVRLLSGDFTKIVVIAIVIALPVSYLIARNWLNEFAFRIDLEWWYFITAGLAALLIAWFTVGLQTVRAARVNPVECLKEE